MKATPVRIVDHVEASLRFWCDALGYEKRAEIAHEGALGFVLLEDGAGGELMLQSRASLAADLPAVAALTPHTVLVLEVASLAAARDASRGAKVILEERTTSYGTRETVVLDPAGTVVVFAEKT